MRYDSSMTPEEFCEWCERHQITKWKTVRALGISYTMYYHYRNGSFPIPLTIQLLCDALDQISAYKRYACTVHDLADIVAHPK